MTIEELYDAAIEDHGVQELVEYARRQAAYCCQDGCGSGACETCPCCSAGWCVSGADGLPDDPDDLALWLEVAAEYNPVAAALAKATGSSDSTDPCPEWQCPDLSSEDRREGRTCPEHPCTCSSKPSP